MEGFHLSAVNLPLPCRIWLELRTLNTSQPSPNSMAREPKHNMALWVAGMIRGSFHGFLMRLLSEKIVNKYAAEQQSTDTMVDRGVYLGCQVKFSMMSMMHNL